jgi:hypothetical protein
LNPLSIYNYLKTNEIALDSQAVRHNPQPKHLYGSMLAIDLPFSVLLLMALK